MNSWTDFPSIALIGRMGSGKTTARNLLEQHLAYHHVSFAAALRDTIVDLWGAEKREDRYLLQSVGHGLRAVDADVWVNRLLRNLDPHTLSPPWVCDDCRYPNELAALKAEGFVSLRIFTPQATRVDRLKRNGRWTDEAALYHESETALNNVQADFTIQNTGSTFDLHTDLMETIRGIRRAVPA